MPFCSCPRSAEYRSVPSSGDEFGSKTGSKHAALGHSSFRKGLSDSLPSGREEGAKSLMAARTAKSNVKAASEAYILQGSVPF